TVQPLHELSAGQLIEVVLPGNVFAFGVNLVITGATIADVCLEASTTFSSTCNATNQEAVWTVGNTEFMGVTSDTAISTVWIGLSINASQTPTVEISSFEDATGVGTPEVQTLGMLGSGLVLIGLIRL